MDQVENKEAVEEAVRQSLWMKVKYAWEISHSIANLCGKFNDPNPSSKVNDLKKQKSYSSIPHSKSKCENKILKKNNEWELILYDFKMHYKAIQNSVIVA